MSGYTRGTKYKGFKLYSYAYTVIDLTDLGSSEELLKSGFGNILSLSWIYYLGKRVFWLYGMKQFPARLLR